MKAMQMPIVLMATILVAPAPALSQTPAAPTLAQVAEQVNQKLVKVFGSGGFRGITAYGTGVMVSPDGYVLTVAAPLLDTPDLRVHLYDGRRLHAKVVVTEPELDIALIKIDKVDDLPYFDLAEAAKRPLAEPGTRVVAFSNLFEIATRSEPMSVQQGVIAAYSRLYGRKGIFEVPYKGEVYVIDAITNNPGAGGGVITTRRGELLGLIGKELRNTLTDTWINYAMPIQARVEIKRGDQVTTVSVLDFAERAKRGEYKPIVVERPATGQGGYHGIVLVPNVVERTPPFIEEIQRDSPAAKSGLKPDDLIVYVDGERVVSIRAFRDIMDKVPPGTMVKLEVRRGDKLVGVDLKLEASKTPPKK
jgi:serine protease Do